MAVDRLDQCHLNLRLSNQDNLSQLRFSLALSRPKNEMRPGHGDAWLGPNNFSIC